MLYYLYVLTQYLEIVTLLRKSMNTIWKKTQNAYRGGVKHTAMLNQTSKLQKGK